MLVDDHPRRVSGALTSSGDDERIRRDDRGERLLRVEGITPESLPALAGEPSQAATPSPGPLRAALFVVTETNSNPMEGTL